MEDVTIGLALGVGAARGWAHIGIIQALVDIGIRPDSSAELQPALLWVGLMPQEAV